MAKNITALLQKGSIKPRERVLLLVANQVSEETTGKSILTEADKHALSEGWTPKDNNEVKEYNRYNEGWRNAGFAELDAQTTYLKATNNLLRAGRLIDMVVLKDEKNILDFYKDFIKNNFESKDNALEFVIQNSGLEFDYVIYRYAFESLSGDIQKDILALNPDAKTETQYLDQEEIIANLFNGKDELTKEAKEKLADLIVKSLYNKYVSVFKKLDGENDLKEEYFFSGYYGELVGVEILKKWAEYKKISYKDIGEIKDYADKKSEELKAELTKKIKDYAETHKTGIGELLKQTILKWLDEGLFIKDYTPIFNSDEKNTCNDTDTKLSHKEVFKEWLKAKKKAEQTTQGLIEKGELKVVEKIEEIKRFSKRADGGLERSDKDPFKRTLQLITGESLYNLKGDFTFAKDFKKQADDLKGIGGLIMFLRECRFLKQYGILLEFLELFKRLSKVYEIDLTYKTKGWIADFKGDIEMLNGEILMVGEKMKQASYEKHGITFLNNTFIEDMLIDLETIKPSRDGQEGGVYMLNIGRYYEEFKKIFGEEF